MIRIVAALSLMTVLAACETVQGFGRDVESGGEIIQQSADEVQDDL